jgi:hypothetical protein
LQLLVGGCLAGVADGTASRRRGVSVPKPRLAVTRRQIGDGAAVQRLQRAHSGLG